MRVNPKIMTCALALASTALFAQVPAKPSAKELIGVLRQSGASLHDMARACQQLGEFGTAEAIPVLAALLRDPELGAYARSGLEGIPDPGAAAALRAALPGLKGSLRIGVVNSLAVLRDRQAVGALGKLAGDPGSGAAKEALLALGRISDPEAIAILRRALSTGPEALRPDAASACLLAAEFQLRANNSQTAIALYDAVRAAGIPSSYRLAATRGAILARKAAGVELLAKLLRSDDRETRNAALGAARALREPSLAPALNAEFRAAKPEVQAQILAALADCCRDPESVRLIRSQAAAGNPEIAAAAIHALGKIGNRADVPLLLKTVADDRNPLESAAAVESLARIEGGEVDSEILAALASSTAPGPRRALIDLLDARPPLRESVPELLRHAGGPDLDVSLAALHTIRSVAGPGDLPRLIAVTRNCKDGAQRAAAESALFFASTRTDDPAPSAELLLAELKHRGEDLDKASWIRTLCSLGYAGALPEIAANLRSPNPWLAGATIDNLGKWPGPAPISELLGIAQTATDAGLRARALNAAVGLAATAGEKRQAPDTEVAAWFRGAGQSARSAAEKRAIVDGLARWRNLESFRLLTPYLDDPDVKAAAVSAILTVAQPVAESSDFAIVKPVLEKISAAADQTLAERLAALKKTIAASESKYR
jgi:HEAT repeat protein